MKITLSKGSRFRIMFILAILDALSIACSFFFALWLRHDFKFNVISETYIETYIKSIGVWIIVSFIVFSLMKLYNNILTFAGQDDLFRIIISYGILAVIGVVGIIIFDPNMPKSYYILGWILSFVSTVVIRFSRRTLKSVGHLFSSLHHSSNDESIMIIGAGLAGRMLLREYNESDKLRGKVACFIDDNPEKAGCRLDGIPIVGGRDKIIESASKYNIDKIIYAIPSGDGKTRKAILDICCETGCKVEIVPGIYQLVNGQADTRKLRKVEIRDLLGRDAVEVNLDEIYKYISDKVVMVTGGGGSIGSELCRQIALSKPKQLIIFDIYENNAYEIQQELVRKYPHLNLVVLIGSVRNTARLDYVLSTYKPDMVFHAAAHKHVPLMEDSPNEAIKNNVFGTYKMAKAAVAHNVKKFVLISTDKAVNPTNIMGASKRLCEMVVQMMNREAPNTEFVAVRFGNVLGSNGSVIPLFEKQIAQGGPVTVTHPDITRFFMTIPEAVSLVLQAGYYAKGGEIYVLDMGQPVRIADMARNLIRLSGYEPDYDIRIEYTGLRPGEKLYEELLMDEEGLQDTDNKLIHIGKPIEMDDEEFKRQLERLEEAYKVEATNMKDIVAEIVPTYKRNNK
ncbi:MAG: polysaccharide biosynthesis protein [Clostridia bacterium]|nr:polysaccharide biosynthesis protein [Clostridia bacterium]MBO5911925.1 polysaccharide biosynthesis protein [Clostridia bacterium]